MSRDSLRLTADVIESWLPPSTKAVFPGDRYGKSTDPFRHEWGIATHIEDVSLEETQKRLAAMSS